MGGRLPVLLTATLSLMVTPAMSEPKKWSQVGALNCTMGPSIGLVMGSLQKARCVFRPDGTKAREFYTGRIDLEGADLGIIPGGKFSWMVMAEPQSLTANGLVGRYVGTSEEIGLNGNDGGNALCNGPEHSVCLRPVTSASEEDEDLAFGVSALQLQ
jgi:hypothetical protein